MVGIRQQGIMMFRRCAFLVFCAIFALALCSAAYGWTSGMTAMAAACGFMALVSAFGMWFVATADDGHEKYEDFH